MAICTNGFTSNGKNEPRQLRCGHSFCADCIVDLHRHAANNTIPCPNRCGLATPVLVDVDVPKNYALAAAVERNEQQELQQLTLLHKCATAAHSLTPPEVAQVMQMCGLSHATDTLPNMRSRLHGHLTSSIEGSKVTRLHEMFITKSTRDGPSYGDFLRCVGDASGLVFVVIKDKYVFGAFISTSIQLPDDLAGDNRYECDVWHFSLAGHFRQLTKIAAKGRETVNVAGREGLTAAGAKLEIGGCLDLGCVPAADDIRSCYQFIHSGDVPEGYMGVRYGFANALFGGSRMFMADNVEVLSVA
ncbi:unnamed protein product [Vitrella brassicaformis CCMP3155]|uniref:RING-type domain-containing protein n=3 Tax=Vitrella brassicaformis TaxID=1169539 RepID=A0A0G4EMY0_VITBC|nr:unnamed protein product [Vitrella brassicaformis CCMP3155]|eukprot:CEL98340.1 unnamed protein product [Vitrella brassicaformis CCMP3155]